MVEELWRSPLQPSAPSRTGCKARASWSVPWPAELKNLQGWRSHHHSRPCLVHGNQSFLCHYQRLPAFMASCRSSSRHDWMSLPHVLQGDHNHFPSGHWTPNFTLVSPALVGLLLRKGERKVKQMC